MTCGPRQISSPVWPSGTGVLPSTASTTTRSVSGTATPTEPGLRTCIGLIVRMFEVSDMP